MNDSTKVSRFKAPSAPSSDRPAWMSLRPRSAPLDGAQTLPGRLAEDSAKGLQQQIDSLRAEREGGRVILTLRPTQIAITALANRHHASLAAEDPKMLELVSSLRAKGQDTPVVVRPAPEGAATPYELVLGHRRLAACLYLDKEIEGGFPIQARLDVSAADTRELALKMYRENEERLDLSPYEKGCMFKKWLDAGLYRRAREISETIGMNESNVGRYIAVADLPEEVLRAFTDVREIPVRAAAALNAALSGNRAAVVQEAVKIAKANPRLAADAVIQALANAGTKPAKKRDARMTREESVRINGRVPLKVASRGNRINLKLAHLEPADQKAFADDLKDWATQWLRKRIEK